MITEPGLKADVTPFTTMKSSDEAKETVVPETVMAEPGRSVEPPMTYSPIVCTVGANVDPAMISAEDGCRVDVAPLTTTIVDELPDPSETVVPDTVITPPGVRVWPFTVNLVTGTGANTLPSMVRAGADVIGPEGTGGRVSVCPFTTRIDALGPNEITVLLTVIAGPPGARV